MTTAITSHAKSALCAALALVAASPAARANEPRELRGVVIPAADADVLDSRASIADALDFLARHHVNVVYPSVWYRGVTLHPSDVLERACGVRQDPRYAGRDPLAEIVVEAHRRGIEVVPSFEYGFAAANTAAPSALLEKKPAWAARDRQGKVVERNGFVWLNALDPDVQRFAAALVAEVVQRYDVDGVQGDDRFPALPATAGYDTPTVETWRKDKRLSAPVPEDPRWIAWRAGILTDFLARLAQDTRAAGSGVLVAASPAPYRRSLDESLQDSRIWLERGLVDLFHPQCHRRELVNYAKIAEEQRELVPKSSRSVYAPSILIRSGAWRIDAGELVRMVEHNRDRGYGGEVLLDYAGLRADGGELARALLAGPYEERARMPHRAGAWRPRAKEIAPRPLSGPEPWERERGAVRAPRSGRSEVAWTLESPASGWHTVCVEVPASGDAPITASRTLAGAEAPIVLRPGLVEVGAVNLDGRAPVEMRVVTSAEENARLAVGRAVLVIDRKRSPGAVWREN